MDGPMTSRTPEGAETEPDGEVIWAVVVVHGVGESRNVQVAKRWFEEVWNQRRTETVLLYAEAKP
jgi:hypothetical protein